MSRWIVHGVVTISVYTVVEAEDRAGAVAAAGERTTSALAHGACIESADGAWVTGELDGELQVIDVNEDADV